MMPGAPLATPSRAEVVRALRDRGAAALPVVLGRGAAEAVLQADEGGFALRVLEVAAQDREALARESEEALAAGRGWVPEDVERWKKPGRVLWRAADVAAAIAALEAATWTRSPLE